MKKLFYAVIISALIVGCCECKKDIAVKECCKPTLVKPTKKEKCPCESVNGKSICDPCECDSFLKCCDMPY